MAYAHGTGTAPAAGTARQWLERAALQNYAIAQRQLAGMLLNTGSRQDRIHAYAWYSLAARSGERVDLDTLARLKRQLAAEEVRLGRQLAAQLAGSLSSAGDGSPRAGARAAERDTATGNARAAASTGLRPVPENATP